MSRYPYFADCSLISALSSDPKMLPCYEYFAQGIQRHTSLETFKIANFHLPPSSWLRNNIMPPLENISTLKTLELSNCSMSPDGLNSLSDFVFNNTTLSTLNISRTSIEPEETVKALTKALKKHPSICNINLSHCTFAGGSTAVDKILSACKNCDTLEIGHEDFDTESVAHV